MLNFSKPTLDDWSSVVDSWGSVVGGNWGGGEGLDDWGGVVDGWGSSISWGSVGRSAVESGGDNAGRSGRGEGEEGDDLCNGKIFHKLAPQIFTALK